MRDKYKDTSQMDNQVMSEVEEFYIGDNSQFNTMKKIFPQTPRRKITDEEYNNKVQRNLEYYRKTGRLYGVDQPGYMMGN